MRADGGGVLPKAVEGVDRTLHPPTQGPRSGLTEDDAAGRLERFGPNEIPSPPRPGWLRRLARQLFEPMSVLLLVAAAVEGPLLGERLEAAAIATIVVLNGVIGTIQEGRAQRALDALRAMEPRSATVIRDGRPRRVPLAEVVPGDLVVLAAGERVPADVELREANALEIDESMLTGESLAVEKRVGSGDAGRAQAGTIVTRGDAVGVVTATGADSALGGIAAELGEERAPTPLQRKLHGLTRILGIAAVALAALVLALSLVRSGFGDQAIRDAFLSSVALAVAAVPEGLPAVITVALALGVRRMAERGAIVRRLPAVETLGSSTVILTDKTGTLTENRMAVDRIVTMHGRELDPTGDIPAGLIRAIVLGSEATLDPPTGDPLEVALLEVVGGDEVRRIRDAERRVATVPFDASTRRSITVSEGSSGPIAVMKGAPEVVLPACEEDTDAPKTLEVARRMAGSGQRVIAFGVAEAAAVDRERPEASSYRFAGLVGLRDPVRGAAADAVRAAAAAGIRVVMVTGDHAGTASSVAREVGLLADDDDVIEGWDLQEGSGVDPDRVAVYARVLPADKLDIVRSFQAHGEVVAVTGDGVNDAPALRQADIGVAMGRTGSDVAREAADMVLTDDDLDTIVDAVQEGRRLFGNIRKVVDYLVAGNLSEVAVVIGALAFFPAAGAALTPLQLLWINLLTDGLPAVALGAAPAGDRPAPRWEARTLLSWRTARALAIRAAAIAGASLGALVVMRFALDASWQAARTAMFTVLVLSHLLYGFAVWLDRPGERPAPISEIWRSGGLLLAVGLGVALQITIVAIPAAHGVFDLVSLGGIGWLVSVAGAAISLVLIRLLGARP